MQSISLADELTLERAPAGVEQDEVVCPGVQGAPEENLAARALAAFRAATGWDAPPLRLSIVKRIPVAAGLGGGSADAAAALRLARHASGLGDDAAAARAGRGAGRRCARADRSRAAGWPAAPASCWRRCRIPTRRRSACSSCPRRPGYRRPRSMRRPIGWVSRAPREALEERRRALRRALELSAAVPAASELLENDLQRAAISLCPEIAAALSAGARGGRGDRAGERLGADGARAVPPRQRSRPRRTGPRPRPIGDAGGRPICASVDAVAPSRPTLCRFTRGSTRTVRACEPPL